MDIPTCDLPDELLISIFRLIADSVDTAQVYKDLISLQLVCKWKIVAQATMCSRVEVVGSKDALALEWTLTTHAADGRRLAIDTLVVGVAQSLQGLTNCVQLDRLFALAPDIRKLVVVNIDFGPRLPTVQALESLSLLTSLVDVTITTSTTPITATIPINLIRSLPSQVRFHQLTGNPNVPPDERIHRLTFQLYGLTIQEYPTFMTEWVLSRSRETLQCLTIDTIHHLDHLAECHPNLRSLRILSPADMPTPPRFQNLSKLERLELRAQNVRGTLVETLPIHFLFIPPTAAFMATTAIFLDIRYRTGPKLGVAFGAGVSIQGNQYAATSLIKQRRSLDLTVLVDLGLFTGVYSLALAVLMFSEVPHADSVTIGLGIAGGACLVISGVACIVVSMRT